MQKHTNSLIVAAVLIAAAAIGGVFVFTAHERTAVLDAAANDVASRIDRMIATAGDIASAEQAYVAPGQPDQPWLDRAAMLLQQFGQDAAAIRPLLQSHDAAALAAVEKTFKSIVAIDGRVREEMQQEQNLLAADLIFSEGHDTVAGLVMALRNLDASERQTVAAQRASVEREQWAALAGVAVIWGVGLLTLVPVRGGSGMRDPGSVTRGSLNLEPPDAGSPSTSLGASRIPDAGLITPRSRSASELTLTPGGPIGRRRSNRAFAARPSSPAGRYCQRARRTSGIRADTRSRQSARASSPAACGACRTAAR